MKINRSVFSLVAAGSLALAAMGMAGAAQAQDVYWSVGVSSPGVRVGVANAPPVVVQPVYMQQRYPVYVAQPPVVYVQPAPVFVGQPQYIQGGWQPPGRAWGWRHGHRHHEHERFGPGRFEGERWEHERNDHRR
ncbi:MAG: hypothetical protein V4713_07165 [Pseudomonadota bacterium]